MSSITAGTYPESVSSCCHAPTPPPSPSPSPHPAPAIHGAPLSRRFDFPNASSGGDPEEEEEYDDDFIRAVGYIERAKPCGCGRGCCKVERDEQRGRWVYVCPAKPVSLRTHLRTLFLSLILPPRFNHCSI